MIDVYASQSSEIARYGNQMHFSEVVAEAQRRGRMIRLSKRMSGRMAAKSYEERGFLSPQLETFFRSLRDRTKHLFQCLGIIGVLVKQRNTLQEVLCSRGMKGAGIIENEILGHLTCVVRKHLSLHTDDLDGKTSCSRDMVGEYIAGNGRKAHDRSIASCLREHPSP